MVRWSGNTHFTHREKYQARARGDCFSGRFLKRFQCFARWPRSRQRVDLCVIRRPGIVVIKTILFHPPPHSAMRVCMLERVCSCRRKKRAPAHRLAYLTAGLQHEASFSLPAREVRNSRSRPPPALDGHRGLWVSEQCPSGHVAFQPRVCSVPPPRRRRRRWEWGTRWRV